MPTQAPPKADISPPPPPLPRALVQALGATLLCALTGACAGSTLTSAGGQRLVGGAAGSPCDPALRNEGCFVKVGGVQARMRCDATSATWQEIETCASPAYCTQRPDPASPGGSGLLTGCTSTFDAGRAGDGGASGDGGGTADATGAGTDSAGAGTDSSSAGTDTGGAPVNTPELDPGCVDGKYKEALPDKGASLSAAFAAYDKTKVLAFIYATLGARYPWGSTLIKGALKAAPQSCVDIFLPPNMRGSPAQVMNQMEVLVHECGHMYDMYPMSFQTSKYALAPGVLFECTGLRSDSADGGSSGANPSFPRSAIKQDAFGKKRPPCEEGKGSHGCDGYAKIYLNGDPSNGKFESGDQGLNMLLEEVTQYVNSLATRYAFADQGAMSTSARDGILTFLWYMQRYLHMTRTKHPKAYTYFKSQPCWRRLVLSLWGRAWLFLHATENMPKLGIEDDKLIELVRDPLLMAEIGHVRVAEGCE